MEKLKLNDVITVYRDAGAEEVIFRFADIGVPITGICLDKKETATLRKWLNQLEKN